MAGNPILKIKAYFFALCSGCKIPVTFQAPNDFLEGYASSVTNEGKTSIYYFVIDCRTVQYGSVQLVKYCVVGEVLCNELECTTGQYGI